MCRMPRGYCIRWSFYSCTQPSTFIIFLFLFLTEVTHQCQDRLCEEARSIANMPLPNIQCSLGIFQVALTRLVWNLTLYNDCILIPLVQETKQLSSLNDHLTWLMTQSFRREWWVHGRNRTADCWHEKGEPLPLDHRGSSVKISTDAFTKQSVKVKVA